MSKFLSILFLFSCISLGFSQNGKNIRTFEYRKWHFGTMLGVTTSTFNYQLKPNFQNSDSVFNVAIKSRPGLAIHIPVISWNLHSTVHLRFITSLTFHETLFSYSYFRGGKSRLRETTTTPTNLNFPLLLKISSKRLNNFSAYAQGGFGYSLDLATNQDVEQTELDPVIKLKRDDWQYHVGGGFDFYLPYFKFGIDIKYSRGITDLLIQDDTFYSSPLSYLKTSIWWFSITFEG